MLLAIVGDPQVEKCCKMKKGPTKSICASPGSRETALGTGVTDTRDSIRLGRACNGSSGRVHEGQRGTDQSRTTPSDDELSANALSKSSIDTGVLPSSAAGVRGKRGKLSVQLLSILSILKLETSGLRGRRIRRRRRSWLVVSGFVVDRFVIGLVSLISLVPNQYGRGFCSTATGAGVLGDIDELLTIWNRAVRTSGAGSCGIQGGRKAEGDRAWASGWNAANKGLGLGTCELALEQSRKLRVLRCLLAVLDAFRARRVTGLLAENLSQLDHLSVIVELLGEIDHLVSCVLLCAWSRSGQKGAECSHGDRVTLFCASCGATSSLPLLGSSSDNLSDTLGVKGCSLCSRKGEGEQEDLGKAEHCEGNEGR